MLRTAFVSAGRVPDGSTGPPLLVAKAEGGQIRLDWGPSCFATDTDYEIYEGTIGSYYSHAQKFCTTGGATTKTFTQPAGNTTRKHSMPIAMSSSTSDCAVPSPASSRS